MKKITLAPHISGDTWRGLWVTVNVNGSPMNLTGATIVMRMGTYLWTTADASIVITDAAAGKFTANSRIVSGNSDMTFDIKVTSASGEVTTVAIGTQPMVRS